MKNTSKLIIGLLGVNISAACLFFYFWDSKRVVEIDRVQKEYVVIDSTKNAVEEFYHQALTRIDLMKDTMKRKDQQVVKLKRRIEDLLKKSKMDKEDIELATNLIVSLNERVGVLDKELADTKQANVKLNDDLTAEKEVTSKLSVDLDDLKGEKANLIAIIDDAKTLTASDIKVIPVNERTTGKDVEVTKSKKVDKIVISFDVYNRINGDEMTDVYICLTDPNGEHIGPQNQIVTKDGDKLITGKMVLTIDPDKKKHVVYTWRQLKYIPGTYKVLIYHNSYVIGEKTFELKKGGLI